MSNKTLENIVILVNGTVDSPQLHKNILSQSDVIICADGGANHAKRLDVIPDYVIGDMDSVEPKLLQQLQENQTTQVIIDEDQNKTDFELAIELAISLNPESIIILGAIGDNMDHTLANILSLKNIPAHIQASIVDANNAINLVTDEIEINGKQDEIVSVIALTEITGLTYNGLKWPMTNADVPFGWLGIRNRMLGDKASISLTSGIIAVIKPLTKT